MANDLHYLERLAEQYPTISKASAEIINLQSVLDLPKGTEHFMSDIHGEYEAFSHVLRNGSGAVRKKIDDVFGHTLGSREKCALATLIYYPKERIVMARKSEPDLENWYQVSLYRLIELCKAVASKYTRAKVRKALPEDFAYIIEELISEKSEVLDKEAYYDSIVQTIIELRQAEDFIVAMAALIQRLVVDHLHIIGDIYDRGPGPHLIMDRLCDYHSLDIQWGNHDILWLGAAAGHPACIANVIRICLRYGNLDILEDGYGINMLPLATFALSAYADDPCGQFKLRGQNALNKEESAVAIKMHKAITVIQFKLEGQLILSEPENGMSDRLLLDKIDWDKGTVTVEGMEYALLDTTFPTVDPADPYKLTDQEADVIERLQNAFRGCARLQKHRALLLRVGGLYKIYNNNLLYHGCVPMDENGDLQEVTIYGRPCKGKALYDVLDTYVRRAFNSLDPLDRERGGNVMWYLWNAPFSPLFGRSKMATFERYLLAEKETHKEEKNPYYTHLEDPKTADTILASFGMDKPNAHIINGHMPVRQLNGENPVKCGGRILVIDGGFSRAYHKETGIAGYTLIYNSYGLTLTAHEPFESTEAAVSEEKDIVSRRVAVQKSRERLMVGDTDAGAKMRVRIAELKELIDVYRAGAIPEK